MENKRIYTIQINGIKESIDAVNSLNKQLNELESRIKTLESANVKVGASSTSRGSNTASLSEEEKLTKQIEQIDAKREAYSKEIYQNYLAAKDVLKETVNDQKQLAAAERVQADSYSNTMEGMKQKLADLKSVHFTTDISTDEFKNQTKEINDLNEALKKLQQEYGVFNRSVGDYKTAAEGFKGLSITVAGVTQNFDNAKQALKTLQTDLRTLQVKKDQGVILSEDEVKRFEELPEVVAKLKSSIADAGKPMDSLMDTMQSLVAIAQVSKGFSAFFGIDDDEIQRSIQKLVGLQNAMKGLQEIQQQLQSKEFLGGIFTKASAAIDTFSAKVTSSEKATKRLALSLKVLSGIAVAAFIYSIVKSLQDLKKEEDQVNQATEEGIKEYAKAESELSQLKTKLDNFNGSKKQEEKLVNSLNSKYGDSIGQYKSLAQWKDALAKKGTAYCKVLQKEAELQAILSLYTENYIKLQKARKAQEEGQQDTVDLILKTLKGEAKIGQVLASIRDDIKAPFSNNLTEYNDYLEGEIDKLENNGEQLLGKAKEIQTEIDEINKENKIGDYAPQIDKNGKKSKDAVKKNEEELEQLRLKLMKEGLNKTLKQLDIEKNALIEKIKQTGKNVADKIKEVNDIYAKLRTAEIKKYIIKVEEELKKGAEGIKKIEFEVKDADLSNQIDKITEKIQNLSLAAPKSNTITTTLDYKTITKGVDVNKLDAAMMYENLFNVADVTGKGDEFYKFLINYLKGKNADVQRELLAAFNNTEGTQIEKLNNLYTTLEKKFEEEYSKELTLIRENQGAITKSLSESFEQRIQINKAYNESVVEQQIDLYKKLQKNEEERLNLEESNRLEDIKKEKDSINTKLDLHKQELEDVVQNFKETSAATASFYENGYAKYQEYEEKLKALIEEYTNEKSVSKKKELETTITTLEKERDAYLNKNPLIAEYKAYQDASNKIEEIEKQMSDNAIAYSEKESAVITEYANKRKQLETDTSLDIKRTKQKFYDNSLTNLREFLSSTNDALNNSMKYFEGWGILNYGGTKKNLKEVKDAVTTVLGNIKEQKKQLDKDFKDGLITPDERNTTMSQLNDMEKSFKEVGKEVAEELKMVGVELWGSINNWIQNVGQAANSILSSLSEITQNQYQAQIDEQEKYIEEYGKLLDKQEEITKEHNDKVNDIEDELKTARGDRRQQLIDNLNAEMAAQRASLAQEKKIEKEKEKADEKKKKLEHDQAVAKKKMDLAQAYINAAMAVSMAAVNHWPVPALGMMALAAAAGAAQIAAVQSQNIPSYGSGGLLEGKSHRDGGIKTSIGSSPIELEGHEYVIRKKTTEKNVQLLDYINKSERKLNINDFIDFYSSGNVKKNIVSANPKTRFENGGQIPILRNDIDMNNRLIDAMTAYANRPMYVAVTEIEDKMADVNYIRTVAGVNNN